MDYRTEIEIIILRIQKILLNNKHGIVKLNNEDRDSLTEAKLLLENLKCLNEEE